MRSVLLAATLLAVAPVFATDDEPAYLFDIPVDVADEVLGNRIAATLHLPDALRARSIIEASGALEVLAGDPDTLLVALDGNDTFGGEPAAQHRQDSWVIDYREASVQAVIDEIATQHDGPPDIDTLTQFVFEFIDDKAYAGTFELASKVAETRSGDCTEHAVLLAGLARAFGYPARVAIGVVLVESDEKSGGYGHAWVEIHNGEAWIIADGTRPESAAEDIRVRYLPFLNMQNEGPGYGLDLSAIMHVQPSRISGLRNLD